MKLISSNISSSDTIIMKLIWSNSSSYRQIGQFPFDVCRW